MAGAKGCSGGPRPNSGGARPGAGRPKGVKNRPKPVQEPTSTPAEGVSHAHPNATPDEDMLALLRRIALGQIDATPIQVRAAIAAVQYTHTKRGDGGKKEEAAEKAKKAAAGRFGVRKGPPALKVVRA